MSSRGLQPARALSPLAALWSRTWTTPLFALSNPVAGGNVVGTFPSSQLVGLSMATAAYNDDFHNLVNIAAEHDPAAAGLMERTRG